MGAKKKGKGGKEASSKKSQQETPAEFQQFGSLVKKVDTSTLAALTVFLSSSNSWAATCY